MAYERNETVANLLVQFVRHRDGDPRDEVLRLDLTKGQLPVELTRDQARDLANLIQEEFE